MRMLFGYMKKYKKESILAPLFKLLEALFDLLVPLVVARMIDSGAGERKTVLLCFGGLLAMAAVGFACSVVAQYFAAKASIGTASALRQELFDHIQSFSYTELDRMGSDTLITRLTDDVNQVQTGLNLALRLLLRSPFIVFGAVAMAFTVNVRCAIVFAVSIPVLLAVTLLIMRISIPLFGKTQARLDAVTAHTRENLTGVRVIRAFCREEQSADEFARSSRALTRMHIFVGRISALLNPITYVLINLATVLLIRKAAIQVNLGTLRQGQVVALYNYMLQIIVELIKLASLIITLNKSMACMKRTESVLTVRPSMEEPTADAVMTKDSDAVAFQNVSFTYAGAGAPSLTDVSFTAKRGQTIGIIGGTGSGKSTLVNLLARFYDATAGRVCINGQDVRALRQETLRARIGVVPQRAVLFRGSIRDNLRWGNAQASDAALWEALTVAQAREVVEGKAGGLDFMLEQNGRNLSGGQRQRLTIARALVKQPEILILDDSASALDLATDAALRRAIRDLPAETTTFIVSQRISGVQQADQILVLDNGALVGVGTHAALMQHCGVYQEIYYSQFPEERPSEGKEGTAL